jgi:hypothetical protein
VPYPMRGGESDSLYTPHACLLLLARQGSGAGALSSGAILIRFHRVDFFLITTDSTWLPCMHGVPLQTNGIPNLFRVSQASCCPADLANMCIMDAAFSGCYIFPVQ